MEYFGSLKKPGFGFEKSRGYLIGHEDPTMRLVQFHCLFNLATA